MLRHAREDSYVESEVVRLRLDVEAGVVLSMVMVVGL